MAISLQARDLWQSSDLYEFPPAYSTSLARRIGLPFTPTATIPPQTSSPQASTVSTPATIGISIGAVLGFHFDSVTIVFLLLRRHQRKCATTTTEPARPGTPEMEDQDATLAKRKWFLGGRWRSEAEVKNESRELDLRGMYVVPGAPAELEATQGR